MNTRFRPTPTGDLHLGHPLIAAENYKWASASGGEFVVIIDDLCSWVQNVPYWAGPPQSWAARYEEDLAWLGIAPDRVVFSLENVEGHAEVAGRLGIRRPTLRQPWTWQPNRIPAIDFNMSGGEPDPECGAWHNAPAGGAHLAYWTAVRVADDAHWCIDGFVRGMDLVGEMYLYDHLCRQAGFRSPAQTYWPAVRRAGHVPECTDDCTTLRALRSHGYDGSRVLETLYESARRAHGAGLMSIVIPPGVLGVEGDPVTLKYREAERITRAQTPDDAHPLDAEIRRLCQRDRWFGADNISEKYREGQCDDSRHRRLDA